MGELFIADTRNNGIRMLTAGGTIVTIAAFPALPVSRLATRPPRVLPADSGNHVIRRVQSTSFRRRAVRR